MSVIAALREHCPWMGALTHESLVEYLLEEAHEVAETIETGGGDAELTGRTGRRPAAGGPARPARAGARRLRPRRRRPRPHRQDDPPQSACVPSRRLAAGLLSGDGGGDRPEMGRRQAVRKLLHTEQPPPGTPSTASPPRSRPSPGPRSCWTAPSVPASRRPAPPAPASRPPDSRRRRKRRRRPHRRRRSRHRRGTRRAAVRHRRRRPGQGARRRTRPPRRRPPLPGQPRAPADAMMTSGDWIGFRNLRHSRLG